MPSTPLKGAEPAGQVPGQPEADQLGLLQGPLGVVVPDLGVEVLGRLSGLGERLGDHVLGELVVEAAPSGGGHTTPLATLALVGSEVRGVGHGGTVAWLQLAVKDRFREGEWLTGRLGADRVHCPRCRCPDPSRLPLRAAAPALTDPAHDPVWPERRRLFRRNQPDGTMVGWQSA